MKHPTGRTVALLLCVSIRSEFSFSNIKWASPICPLSLWQTALQSKHSQSRKNRLYMARTTTCFWSDYSIIYENKSKKELQIRQGSDHKLAYFYAISVAKWRNGTWAYVANSPKFLPSLLLWEYNLAREYCLYVTSSWNNSFKNWDG